MQSSIKYVATLVLLVFLLQVSGQDKPVIKQQVNFEQGIDEVFSDYKNGIFLVKAGDMFTLVDQASKIQLGSLQLEAGSWGAPGVGKTAVWKNGTFLLSTAFALLQGDPVTGKTDTIFKAVEFPEMIENFIPWPGNENLLLISTKIYTLKKDKTISYQDEDGNYEGCTQCRWLLYDADKKSIVKSVNVQQYITTFAPVINYENTIVAGTFSGDIIEIDTSLNHTLKFHAFDTAVHSVVAAGGYIVAVPHQEPLYIGEYGGENVYIFDGNGQTARIITLNKQEIKKDEKDIPGISPAPSAHVFRLFTVSGSVYVNYGFSGLLEIKLPEFDTDEYAISYPTAKFFCLSKDGTQLLGATDVIVNLFATARKQELFDLKSRKFQPAFRQYSRQVEFTGISKIKDEQGNYHIIGYKQDFSNDTLVVFSSNRTEPVILACSGCHFQQNGENLTIMRGNKAVSGQILFNKLWKKQYNFSVKKQDEEIFKPVFSTKNVSEDVLPYPIDEVRQITPAEFIITGENQLIVIDTAGNKIHGMGVGGQTLQSELFKVSTSGRWLTVVSESVGHDEIMILEIKTFKTVFAKKVNKPKGIGHYTFDKTRDVLWFAEDWMEKGEYYIDVFSVDLTEKEIKPNKEFSDNSYFSFEVDMEANLIASEAYTDIKLARFSDRKILWHFTPFHQNIKVSHQQQGFTFSSEKEFHTLTPELNYLYFTSYAGYRPVEVANGYLYRGEKSAINNLGFVYNRKGYLPTDYDIYFNRPDTVIQLSGSTNTDFNNVVASAVAKRKRRNNAAGLEDMLASRPKCIINNRPEIREVTEQKDILVLIEADENTTLHVLANGSPVLGTKGLFLNTDIIEITIPLESGPNTIQVYTQSRTGVNSSMETVSIVADYKAEPKTYFIGIGIDNFADSKHNLTYCVKDVRDLATNLKNKLGENVIIDTLFNEQVTTANVRALKARLSKTGVNDKVIVSFSGHGILNKQFDYYLSTYNINFKSPEGAGLPYSALEFLLDSIAARKKLLLIDACHSGEVDKEELNRLKWVLKDSAQLSSGSKDGIELLEEEQPAAGLKNSFELMQELFTDVSRGTGATVISAAAGTQLAYEKGELKNGVFTYCILELLTESPACTVQQLKQTVSAEVEKRTNGLQKPTSRNEIIEFDWRVW